MTLQDEHERHTFESYLSDGERVIGVTFPDGRRREKLDETQRAYDAASEATSSMTNELARLTEELEKVKGVIEDRGENNADATPLNTMKENMEKMREEIKVFEVRVAVCRSALLKHEVKRQAAIVAGKKAGGKKKRRPGADDDTPY